MAVTMGVDPGIATAGAAYRLGDRWYTTCFASSPRDGIDAGRLEMLLRWYRAALEASQAEVLALETQYLRPDLPGGVGKSVLMVARAAGAMVGIAQERGLGVVAVTPQRAKLALTGDGAASKRMMVDAANRSYGLHLLLKDEHAADALGMALAGEAQYRFQQGWKESLTHQMAGMEPGQVTKTAGQAYAEAYGDQHKGVRRRAIG
jgi:crossover junction endodeoxyribonuclease RuvC